MNDRDRLAGVSQVFNEVHNVPVAFYGQVVDQDGSPLPDARVNVGIRETHMPSPMIEQITSTMLYLQKETGADGRFDVTGVKGDAFQIEGISKQGYEMEPAQRNYGTQGGSPGIPVVFRMWSTNIHEQLISGERSFQIIPDGRHYRIRLTNGTIAEGGEGDLSVWVKRPESATYGQRYDWSCEIMGTDGALLLENNSFMAMYIAPATGYTNVFAYHQEANASGWGDTTGDKCFYVRLHNGQMYGRICIELCANFHGKRPGMIRLQYAINPSGSPLLR